MKLYSTVLFYKKFIENQHISILKIQRIFILTVIINQFFSSEIHGPIFSGPWIILPWVSEKSRRLFTVVFCGLLQSFICWKLSQELDKKHWPRIFVIIPPYFLIDVDIIKYRYFQKKLQVDLHVWKKIQHFYNEQSLLMIYFKINIFKMTFYSYTYVWCTVN